jgi:TPR repeat protein
MALSRQAKVVASLRGLPGMWERLGQLVLRCAGLIGDTKYGGERDRSRIVAGYGKAMFNLGWRYERRRNLPEAVRCYFKSSKLGNPDATARLEPTRNELEHGDEVPDPPTRVMPLWREWRSKD